MSNLRKGVLAMLILFLGSANLITTQAQCPVVINSVTTTAPTCNGVCNGTLTVNISGGFAPYIYTLVAFPNPPIQVTSNSTTHVFSGLCGGNAVVAVEAQDGLGGTCNTSQAGITIVAPPALTGALSVTNITCPGGNNGAIDFTPGGGVGGYTYNWSNTATSQDISGLVANTYTVTLTDANACTATFSSPVTQPAAITAPATITPVNCNGNLNGAINITPAGGTPNYTYLWSNTAITEDISGLAAGTYTVTITDASSCTAVFNYTVTQPGSLVLSETHLDESCAGAADGSIDLTVTGGTPGYTYSWSNGGTTQDLSGLGGGLYTVNVSDVNGCSASLPVNIAAGGSVSLSLTVINAACGANDGSIDVTVSGGSGTYTYVWSNSQFTEDISGLSAGAYTITVTDLNNGCTSSITALVSDVTGPDVTGLVTDASSCSTPDGAIDITVSNGTGSYSFSWSPGSAVTEDLTGVPVGTYTVTVVDLVSGCTTLSAFNVDDSNPVIVGINITDPDCGINNGAIDITPSGGLPGYSYLWSTSATSQDISGLGGGVYNITVTDANACTAVEIITLSENGSPTVTANITNITCPGLTDGAIDITVSSGSGSYSYQWSNGPTTQDISGLGANTYIVIVEDLVSGCQAVESYLIDLPGPFIQTIDITPVTCNGDANGAIDITVSGGSMPYSYLWQPGNQITEDLTGLSGGTYTVSVSDNNGCVVPSPTVIVNEPPALVLTETHTNASCGLNNGAINITVSGGTAPYVYSWINGASTEDLTGLAAGLYAVTITDASGCSASMSITILSTNNLILSYTAVNPSCGNTDGLIDLNVTAGSGNYTYLWTPGSITTQDRTGLGAGTYTVVVTDQTSGCTATQVISLSSNNGPVVTAAVTNATNCNATNGAIDVSVSGGSGSYTYLWTPGNAITQDRTNLAIGTYTVMVTDQITGCITVASFSIINGNPVVISPAVTITNATCGSTNGAIDISVSGGAPTYTYVWSNGANTQDISGLGAGTYAVTVTSANGCTATATYSVSTTGGPNIAALVTNINCAGNNNGAIDITPSGGSPGYTYLWSNSATTQDLTGLSAGTYNVVVTDANGCQAFAIYTITSPSPLNGFVNVTNISCNGNNDGAIDITYTGGGTSPFTFVWSSGPTTDDLTGLAAGTYTVTVTDNNGCVTVSPGFTVTQPAALTLTETHTNVTCGGSNNGSIDLTVTGGTSPYVYSWTNGASTQDLSGLAAGLYVVTVTDDNGCSASLNITILPSNPPILSYVATTPSCGNTNGTIDLSVTAGSGNYTYLWTPGSITTQDRTGLGAGTYTVVVTDQTTGCTATQVVNLGNTNGPVVTAVVTNSTNCTATNGAIDVSVSGGSGSYVYLWTPSNATTQDRTNLAIGTYTVRVTDQVTGCITVASFSIVNGNPVVISPTATITNATCGSANGAIDISVSGGAPTYTYIWSNGGITQDISGLAAGTYAVTVTSANGCTATATYSVGTTGGPSLTASVTNILCAGTNNGAIDITPAGGTPGYTYLWSNGATTQDISGLAAGTYNVVVRDANGCQVSAVYTITPANALNGIVSITNITCNGNTNGAINITYTGGASPLTYVWSSGPTTEDLSGLAGGTYTVTITDDNGCVTVSPGFTITQPAVLTLTETHTNVTCNGANNGSIDLTVVGGTTNYSYLWSPGGMITQDLSGLAPGTYTVTVTDANACTATLAITITEPAPILANATSTNITCNGTCNGTATSNPTGGTAPYTYLWSSGPTTPGLTGLCPGSYTVTVTDANGCTATGSVTITQPTPIGASITSTTNVTCFGQCNGAATVTATGGTGSYTYLWNTVPPQITQSATNLCSGSYNVTVTDANGCTIASSVTIIEPALLVATPSATPVSCNGVCDGTATVSVTGGNPPYTYLWSTVPPQTTISITGLCAGTYTVTVTGVLGCTDTASVVVGDPGPILANITTTDVSCNGACDGTATAAPTGGNGPYTYVWGTTPQQTGPLATNLCFGTYNVTITDANNCTSVSQATIGDQASIIITTVQTNTSCNGVCDGAATLTVSGGVSPYTYAWPSGNTTPSETGLCAGTYPVTVTDANGCQATEFVVITEPAVITGKPFTVNESCGGACDGSITLAPSGGTPGYTFVWAPGNQTTPGINNLCAGTYTVTITDINNCTGVETVTITSPPAIIVTSTVTNISCNGGSDGAIDVTVTGGTPGFTYQWDPNGETTQDLSGLSAGTYTITVTDANNCTATSSITVSEPQPIGITPLVTNATCGQCNGIAVVTVTGGTGPFSFLWSDGQTTATATNLCAGVYQVEVTDANGCFQTFSIGVSNIGGPTATVTPTNVSCSGLCDGAASVIASGGTAPYTYLWIPGGMTTSSVAGLCEDTYFVQVQDATGCITTQSVTITGPSAITDNVSVTPTTCGNCNGVIALNPTGGAGSYTYLWSPGLQTTSSISNLCAGVYSVDITDANNCTQNFVYTITNSDGPQLVTSSTNASCNGVCDGTANVVVSGGLAPYTYLWSNGDATATASNLCAGIYTVEVTDNNGCVSYAQVTIGEPTPVSLSFVVQDNPSCNGTCDGQLSVVPSGGTLLYTYLWDDGNSQTTQTATGLCAGSYNVTVTDANGCSTTGNSSLVDPAQLVLSLDTTINASCNGVCDGSATVSATGGTQPYIIVWSNFQTGATATNLCAGSYFAVVQDANGCTDSVNVTITEPTAIVSQLSTTNASCNGVCDGTAQIDTVSGGVGPYTYLWNTSSTADSIGGLCAGAYTVTITDSTGCTSVVTINITEPAPIVLSFATTDVNCNGACDGTITVTPTGGSSPYTYLWNDPNAQTTPTADSLCPGTYTVTVTDANGCFSIDSASIVEPPALALTDSVVDATCGGTCDGEAYVTASGGTPGYTYLWSNNATTPGITGLCAGTYSVTVTDANGCTIVTSVIVNEPAPLVVDVTTVNASCGGVCDGSATVSISGGTGPFVILWSTNETTATISNLCAGPYDVTVTDGNNCSQTVSVIIIEPPVITAAVTDYSEIFCSNVCNAYATVTPNGGVPNYTYLWSDPSGQTTPTAVGLCAGLYTVTVTDTINCSAIAVINIPDSNALAASVPIFTNISCFGVCDGSATVMPTGGVSPYTYAWSNGGSNQTISGLCAGTYTVTVTDNGGCQVVANVTITQPALLSASAVGVDASCGGVCDGTAAAIPTGGTAPYTYLWSDPNSQTDSVATSLCFGNYSVTITDANGCTAIGSAPINEPPVLTISNAVTQPTCTNTNDGAIDLTVGGGVPGYVYAWTPGGNTEDLNGIFPGTYTVLVTDNIGCTITQIVNVSPITPILADAGADINTCVGQTVQLTGGGGVLFSWSPGASLNDSTLASPVASPTETTTYILEVVNGVCVDLDTVVVVVNPNPAIDAGLDVSILSGNSTVLNGTGAGNNGTYVWDPSNSLDDASLQNPTATPGSTTVYYVIGTDENGCSGSDSVRVEIVPGIVFPDGITPNGDGKNDTWIIDNIDFFPQSIVQVYNRWGEMLFSSVGYPVPWDGKYNNKDLPVGTYYYVIDLKTEGIDPYTGPLTIVR